MSDEKARFFELNDDVGLAPPTIEKKGETVPNPKAGEPEPLADVGVLARVPRMDDGELVEDMVRVSAQDPKEPSFSIVGPRTVKATNQAVADALIQSGHYHEVDPPQQKHVAKPESTDEPEKE